jgi:hypothetical protein
MMQSANGMPQPASAVPMEARITAAALLPAFIADEVQGLAGS